MRLLMVPLWLGAVFAAVPAQTQNPATPPSAAEQAFRDGWWAESGQGDLTAALTRYLAAAAADGPPTIRAKALLHAGAVQQRLGKAESAIATFRQLLKEHAGEADLAEQARVHLRELTAIDLRQNYDEWYERRLFSEEVQLQILGKLDELAAALLPPTVKSNQNKTEHENRIVGLRQAILTFGPGAVPPLRKTAVGRHRRLAEESISMLFALGELPPVEALCRSQDWSFEAGPWRTVLKRRGEAGSMPADATDTTARLLAAALAGPDALLQALVNQRPQDEESGLSAITSALLTFAAESRAQTIQVMGLPTTPIMIRRILESTLLEEPYPLTIAEWAAVSHDPLRFELRSVGLGRIVAQLGPRDGDRFDEMLARVDTAVGSGRMVLRNALAGGLTRNCAPEQLPWTSSRLRHTLQLLSGADQETSSVFYAIRLREDLRNLLAEALFDDPRASAATFAPTEGNGPNMALSTLLHPHVDDENTTELLARNWHACLHRVLTRRWGNYDEPMRIDALRVLGQCLHGDYGGLEALRAFCEDIQTNATEAVKAAAQTVLEGMPVN